MQSKYKKTYFLKKTFNVRDGVDLGVRTFDLDQSFYFHDFDCSNNLLYDSCFSVHVFQEKKVRKFMTTVIIPKDSGVFGQAVVQNWNLTF